LKPIFKKVLNREITLGRYKVQGTRHKEGPRIKTKEERQGSGLIGLLKNV
jgi:hypothetical protein